MKDLRNCSLVYNSSTLHGSSSSIRKGLNLKPSLVFQTSSLFQKHRHPSFLQHSFLLTLMSPVLHLGMSFSRVKVQAWSFQRMEADGWRTRPTPPSQQMKWKGKVTGYSNNDVPSPGLCGRVGICQGGCGHRSQSLRRFSTYSCSFYLDAQSRCPFSRTERRQEVGQVEKECWREWLKAGWRQRKSENETNHTVLEPP